MDIGYGSDTYINTDIFRILSKNIIYIIKNNYILFLTELLIIKVKY
jgi:hypothetical protein